MSLCTWSKRRLTHCSSARLIFCRSAAASTAAPESPILVQARLQRSLKLMRRNGRESMWHERQHSVKEREPTLTLRSRAGAKGYLCRFVGQSFNHFSMQSTKLE